MPNNRQVATIIWLGIFVAAALFSRDLRSSMKDIARALVHVKILVPIGALVLFVTGLACTAARFGLWVPQLMTDSVFWFFGTALVLLFNVQRAWESDRFFRRTALGALGVTAFVEFLINDLFVFSLILEFILLPVLTLLTLVSLVSESDETLRPTKRLVDGVRAVAGIGLLAYVVARSYASWPTMDKPLVVRTFVLPVWLLAGTLPLIYLVALYASYEAAFLRIDFGAIRGDSPWRGKLALLIRINTRVRLAGALSSCWASQLAAASSFREAWTEAGKYRASLRVGDAS